MTCEVSFHILICELRLVADTPLSAWTLHSAIQSHVDIYVSQTTFVEVQRSFPYLVSKEFASGGGDVSPRISCKA